MANVSLVSNPTSSKLGKQWITQHLYHNTALTFEKYEYPHNVVDFADKGIEYVHLGCFGVGCSLPVLLHVLRNHICDWSLVDGGHPMYINTQAEVTEATTLHQIVTPRNQQHLNLSSQGAYNKPCELF
ncbi:hypothetical protein H257_15705 [Aphanomyces astaci]|uniref:Uncharacterized protein n=1 Tax=Aphanomyces astaci TaxID=112090 RepID=W4FLI8_APHAT|nr:hypothetical protein H257_15705 [Aphanomyces astaci]ETV68392.1 hypothetical protein H257_15705 [Aphanomyces astaci]|eukprot:XP_009842187.1 hypothetical protein H257_15705 [Aphanomyces astaci]